MGDFFQIYVAKPKNEDELQELEKGTQTRKRSQHFSESTKGMLHNRGSNSHLNLNILPLKHFTCYNKNYSFKFSYSHPNSHIVSLKYFT